MHIDDQGRKRIVEYFKNTSADFKKKTHQNLLDLNPKMASESLVLTRQKDVEILIQSYDIDFCYSIITAVRTLFDKVKADRKIKYINKILDNCNLEYKDNTIVKKGAFGEIKRINTPKGLIARKTLFDRTKKRNLLHEIEIIMKIKQRCEYDNVRNISANIIRFDDFSFDMDFFDYDLEEYIFINKPQVHDRLFIVTQVFDIISRLSIYGILHRDIHPGNFLVDLSGTSPKVVIIDFGLSMEINNPSKLHDYSKVYGRSLYISPRQKSGLDKCNSKTELYSFGKIINFIMTGSPKDHSHLLNKLTKNMISYKYVDIVSFEQDKNQIFREASMQQ